MSSIVQWRERMAWRYSTTHSRVGHSLLRCHTERRWRARLPEIELHRNGLDPARILALMNFPSDATLRRSYYAVAFERVQLDENKNDAFVEIGRDMLDCLVRAPSDRDLRDLSAKQTKRGYIAGEFLLSIYAMDFFPKYFNEPSIRKAIFITQAFARQNQFGDGSKMPTSETTIRKAFAEFRSVAHFWAAMRLHETLPKRDHREVLGSAEADRDFLGIAGMLQDFGCGFVPKRAKPQEPLLDRNTLWNIPASFARLHPLWPAPPEWLIETAKKYRAKA